MSATSAFELFSSTIKGKTIYGIVGVLGLLWGSMRVFWVTEYAMNRIWRTKRQRGFWSAHLVALISIPFMLVFLVLSIALTGLLRIALHGSIPVINMTLQ